MSNELSPLISEYRVLTKEFTRIGAERQRIKEKFAKYMVEYVEETGDDFLWIDGVRVKVHWEYNVHPQVLDELHNVLDLELIKTLRKNNKWNVGLIQNATRNLIVTHPEALKIIERGLQHRVKSVSFLNWDQDLLGQASRLRTRAGKLERRVSRRRERATEHKGVYTEPI